MNISSISKFGSKYGTAINAGFTVASNGYDVFTGKKTVGQAAGSIAKSAISTAGGRLATVGAAALIGGTLAPLVDGAAAGFVIDTALNSLSK